MKQPIIKSSQPIAYKFNRLTPLGYSVKDSCSFEWQGEEYMICTDVGVGGLSVFKLVNGTYQFHQRLYEGKRSLWAPCTIEQNDRLYLVCNWAAEREPWTQYQRIVLIQYFPDRKWIGGIARIEVGGGQGMIDPDIMFLGGMWYLFVVVPDWNWNIYYGTSTGPFGPYTSLHCLSNIAKYGVVEAPKVVIDADGNGWLYWSINPSDSGSIIKRGRLIFEYGFLNVEEDTMYNVTAVESVTCTHPDSWNDRPRATLKDSNGFYIGEIET